ncbi:hypothetical protein VNO77_02710 [Canavalia gladiata]|uniref:Uncharacterized protein n=1 Tax=Canavalia gladiata TaxID=3824 RepID=A0AAN9MVJ1_CANGL
MMELHLRGDVRDEALCFLPAEFVASASGSSLWAIGESSERERKTLLKPFQQNRSFLSFSNPLPDCPFAVDAADVQVKRCEMDL